MSDGVVVMGTAAVNEAAETRVVTKEVGIVDEPVKGIVTTTSGG